MSRSRIIALLAAGMITSLAANEPVQAKWSDVFVDTPGAGGPACMALGSYPDDTTMVMKADRGDHEDGDIVISFINMNWSIKAGDELGTILYAHPEESMGGEPVAVDHGFFSYIPFDNFVSWAGRLKGGQFALYRQGRAIARFDGDGLYETARQMSACRMREFGKR